MTLLEILEMIEFMESLVFMVIRPNMKEIESLRTLRMELVLS
jgi:hypothetical protein